MKHQRLSSIKTEVRNTKLPKEGNTKKRRRGKSNCRRRKEITSDRRTCNRERRAIKERNINQLQDVDTVYLHISTTNVIIRKEILYAL